MSFSVLSIVNRVKLNKPLKEPHSSHSFLSDFILGSQDGLVNVLGILLGISAATSDVRIIFVGALAALGAESISMGAVAYTSTLARRRQYQKAASHELLETKQDPAMEIKEVRDIFKEWGYEGTALETVTDQIASNPKAMQEFMMSFELKLAPVEKDEARRSFGGCAFLNDLRLDHTIDPVFLCDGGNDSCWLNRLGDCEWCVAVYHRRI